MNVLSAHAHPELCSFTTAMKDLAQLTLTQVGRTVQVSDLCHEFQPDSQCRRFPNACQS